MLINGIESNHIDAKDRGLAYGDGLFSTIKVQSGVAQLWDFHLQRLQLGAKALFFPEIDWQQLSAEVHQQVACFADVSEHVLKVILTRGSGGRGYSTQGCDSPLRIISDSAYPHFYSDWRHQGIDIILCESILSKNKQLAGLKTLNRLEQVIIKNELEFKHAVEGIVCDENGFVVEACSANVFIYMNQQWLTPKLDNSGVKGVQRRNILRLAKQNNIEIVESEIHQSQLIEAQSICLTNALMGIVPVKKYQQQTLRLEPCSVLQSIIK
ncbi:aminodeoxychorismate lyase [Psychromonas sp. KJ10-10]|uniref:aminodeoxychorismate lyase n=1 Tax=Psychromonas sp. KJ10-10 TaxID=3391823 RepID=UPI0039B564EA